MTWSFLVFTVLPPTVAKGGGVLIIGHDYDAKTVRTSKDRQATFPNLVHIISDDFSDDKDIHRQRRKLYAQANML